MTLQAMPVLSDRAKILEIIDPCLHDTVNLKHLYQVLAGVFKQWKVQSGIGFFSSIN
jgi:hypothetical protein